MGKPMDHLQAAWAALLRGDLAERDRQCDLAKEAIRNEPRENLKRLMEIDFFVTPAGVAIPIQRMMPRA